MKIAIMGAAGYSGIELVRILSFHPQVEITVITSSTFKNKRLSDVYPEFRERLNLYFEDEEPSSIINRCEAVFLALPAEVSLVVAEEFLKFNRLVIDLSGAFRLKDKTLYKDWYGFEHTNSVLLKQAVYGIPELFKEKISSARFVANPGCYPTAVILAAAPALARDIVYSEIIVDAKSGVSGRGRKVDLAGIFCEINENMYAYKIGNHQHVPEIESVLSDFSKSKINVLFVPQIVPLERGILANVYMPLKQKDIDVDDIIDIYKDFYKNQPFIRILPKGVTPQVKSVSRTNFCDISIFVEKNTLLVLSAIDNLVKGAAGQAVQNFNIMAGWNEEEALL